MQEKKSSMMEVMDESSLEEELEEADHPLTEAILGQGGDIPPGGEIPPIFHRSQHRG